MKSSRLIRSAIVLKLSTLLSIHRVFRNGKYHALFSHKRNRKPGPKGLSKEIIDAIVDIKRRNPTWGRPRIAQQIALALEFSWTKMSSEAF
jgi:putative transposase